MSDVLKKEGEAQRCTQIRKAEHLLEAFIHSWLRDVRSGKKSSCPLGKESSCPPYLLREQEEDAQKNKRGSITLPLPGIYQEISWRYGANLRDIRG